MGEGLEKREEKENSYPSSHYLLFGGGDSFAYDQLDCTQAAIYLDERGFSDGSLSQARRLKGQSERYAGFCPEGDRACDFCGKILTGAEVDILKDGRERCSECSRTVIKKKADFEAMFHLVRDGFCMKYRVDLPSPIEVKVVSQARLAKMQGSKYVPTKYFDPRTVGLAVCRRGEYGMYFENGSPKRELMATAVHEITHIWQYSHWNWKSMQGKYGNRFLAVAEGMAKWAEIQYLYLLNESEYAERRLANEAARDDVYGYGLRMFLNRYPLSKGILLTGDSPFMNVSEPLG